MEYLVALVALTAMEIVLGIDNIVFIAILTGRLPKNQQKSARRLGLALALVMRIVLLCSLTFILQSTQTAFELTQLGLPESWFAEHPEINEVSWKDMILLCGGLFLIGKSVTEIHEQIHNPTHAHGEVKQVTFAAALVQIALLDIVFSLDSVITAVGMVDADGLWVMITAVIVAVIVMMIFSEVVSKFVAENPTIKMLALSFLILIGVMLVAEGAGTEIEKGYIYFAMAFALVVEVLNILVRSKRTGPAGVAADAK